MNKDKLFEILNDWNYWFKPLPNTYERERYSKEIAKKASSKEILVIKGVRRSGKSTLLINEIKRLVSQGVNIKNILFINLEDQRFRVFNEKTLLEDIKNVYLEYIKPSGNFVIMLDEVQNIKGWEQWVLKEYELYNNQIYVTGSNSHLLSKEFGSALSGRYLDIEVFPLSFKEYLRFKNISIDTKAEFLNNQILIKQHFNDYIKYGGFPKVVLIDDEELKKETIKSYYDSILLRDIVARYKLKNYQTLNELSIFLLSNNSTINAYNKLKNNFSTSFDTIKDYIEYLINAYIILTINKFDYSIKKQFANPKKFYAIDTGLSNILSFNLTQKLGSNLENIVFLELQRRGKKIYYYKTLKGLEIDFLIKYDDKIQLIQVSKTLENIETKKRELRVFKEAKKELNSNLEMIVITLDNTTDIEYEDSRIKIVNIFDFLLFDNFI